MYRNVSLCLAEMKTIIFFLCPKNAKKSKSFELGSLNVSAGFKHLPNVSWENVTAA